MPNTEFDRMNDRLIKQMEALEAGRITPDVLSVLSGALNALTQREKMQLRRAVVGRYADDLVARWKRIDLPPV